MKNMLNEGERVEHFLRHMCTVAKIIYNTFKGVNSNSVTNEFAICKNKNQNVVLLLLHALRESYLVYVTITYVGLLTYEYILEQEPKGNNISMERFSSGVSLSWAAVEIKSFRSPLSFGSFRLSFLSLFLSGQSPISADACYRCPNRDTVSGSNRIAFRSAPYANGDL